MAVVDRFIEDPEVLVSGKTSFKIEVPYKLIESGEKGKQKPLIVYLHGFGDNLKKFENTCSSLLEIEAYHLFIQGPYPIYDRSGSRNVSQWGRAWYLYDGKRKQFIKSLELTSEFIQDVIDNLVKHINVERLCVVGYSMGGYVAGYFALTRWKHVNELVVCGARIKTEVISDGGWKNLAHMNVLAVHGKGDESVSAEPQAKAIEELKNNKVNAELILHEGKHEFMDSQILAIKNWLFHHQYKAAQKEHA